YLLAILVIQKSIPPELSKSPATFSPGISAAPATSPPNPDVAKPYSPPVFSPSNVQQPAATEETLGLSPADLAALQGVLLAHPEILSNPQILTNPAILQN